MTKVAIVILNWNGKELLKKFLPEVVKNTEYPQAKIVIADNGSTDDSLEFLRENYPSIEIVSLDKNYGFTGGYNRALKQISAEYYLLLNSDIAPAKGWLRPLIEAIETNKNTAVCVPKIKSFRKPGYFEYAGAAGGYIDKYGFPFCKGRIFNQIEEDKGQYNKQDSVFWASGAAMLVNAELFNSIGGLDEDFFAHMEEIDLCWRLKNRGYKILYIPQSEVFHLGGATLDYSNPRKVYLNFRNNLCLLTKNLPKNKLATKLIQRLLLDGIAAMKFLSSGEYNNFSSVIKAHFCFYSNFMLMYKKRKQNLPLVTTNSHKEMYPCSIAGKFFIHHIKKFSDLNWL